MIPQLFKERPIIAAALCVSVIVLTAAFYTSPAFEQVTETPYVQVAQSNSFVELQSLPQPTGSTNPYSSFAAFLQTIFQLSIIAAGVLAVLMITIAGFEYMGSDKFSTIQKAKSRLWNAIIGLLIVLGAVLILETINPNITGLDIFSDRQEQAEEGGGGSGGNGGDSGDADEDGPSNNRDDYETLTDFYEADPDAAQEWCEDQGGVFELYNAPGGTRASCPGIGDSRESEAATQWCYRTVEQTSGPGPGTGTQSCFEDRAACEVSQEQEPGETTGCEEQEIEQ